jgi:hypothetical protein
MVLKSFQALLKCPLTTLGQFQEWWLKVLAVG